MISIPCSGGMRGSLRSACQGMSRQALQESETDPERRSRGPPDLAFLGRGDRTRTCNPRFWRPVLCQLSYTPTLPQVYHRSLAQVKVLRRAAGPRETQGPSPPPLPHPSSRRPIAGPFRPGPVVLRARGPGRACRAGRLVMSVSRPSGLLAHPAWPAGSC